MRRQFVILVLLITFQANAIAGALMMSDMAALSMSTEMHTLPMHGELKSTPTAHPGQVDNHCTDSMETHHFDECEPSAHSKDHCDHHCDCGLCSGHYFKAVLAESVFIPPASQYTFDSDYLFSRVPVTHPFPLKPPKLI